MSGKGAASPPSFLATELLEALHDDIAIERVQLHQERLTSSQNLAYQRGKDQLPTDADNRLFLPVEFPTTENIKGWILSPRLFSERSPSTCSPKGFAVAVHGTSIQSKAVDPTTQLSSMQLCRADLSPPYTSTSVARAFVVRSSGLPVDSVRRPLSVPEGEETVPTRFPPSRKMRSECFDSFQPFNRPILRKIEQ